MADQLRYIDANDDFKVAPFREGGVTPGTLIWVWAVVVGSGVFVRTASPRSRWFAAAVAQQGGIAQANGDRHTASQWPRRWTQRSAGEECSAV